MTAMRGYRPFFGKYLKPHRKPCQKLTGPWRLTVPKPLNGRRFIALRVSGTLSETHPKLTRVDRFRFVRYRLSPDPVHLGYGVMGYPGHVGESLARLALTFRRILRRVGGLPGYHALLRQLRQVLLQA